ncbi:hypothetical protein [Algibacillus agarilyticus]|uniref:hypothetical protein n=1 Tax=Algibacillus agarilyticus TaxID=2234133 RepID=UPI000DD03886|nr:hypothetical protein [Algibacillus agarilyticus]
MLKKIKSALFKMLIGVAIILYVALNADDKPNLAIPEAAQSEYNQLVKDLNANRTQDALKLIQKLLVLQPSLTASTRVWLYRKQGYLHSQHRHNHLALDSYLNARKLAEDKNTDQANIKLLRANIERNQSERDLKQGYRNARFTGIAKTMQEEVLILYFYLNDNRWSKWSNQDRLKNQANIDQVTAWFKHQSQRYDIANLSFKTRYFFVHSPKGITKEWLRQSSFFPYAKSLISKQVGYDSFEDMINALKETENQNVAVVLHSNGKARSFAMSCRKTKRKANCQNEYVMLTEKMEKSAYSWATQQVQAHEILHLFGAADLYNIQKAKNYATTDLMNYYSNTLKNATLDPITAWSIGWAERPKTPFSITIED